MVNVTLFSQILNYLDRNQFTKAVEKYHTDKHNKGINSWTHLVAMLFCHLSKVTVNKRNNQWIDVDNRKPESFRNTRQNPKEIIIIIYKCP